MTSKTKKFTQKFIYCLVVAAVILGLVAAIYWNITLLITNIVSIIDGIRGTAPSADIAWAVIGLLGRGIIFLVSLILFEIPAMILAFIANLFD